MEQADGSLGNRMEQWFDAVLRAPRQPASRAILIGADCPTLSLAQIQEAHDQLAKHDMVLGPATDGGYYLIGVSAPWTVARFHSIFDEVPWSTDQVLRVTLQRIAAAGLSCYQLKEQEDIDTAAELNRLREQLTAQKANETCGEPSKRWSELGEIIEKILVDDVDCLEPTGCRP
jgi:glycosyltransferase A (GT-A) superfamily protein (DUF2064 family)